MSGSEILRDLAACVVVAIGIIFFASVLSWGLARSRSRVD